VGDDVHSQDPPARGHRGADLSVTEDAERLATQPVQRHSRLEGPVAISHGAVEGECPAAQAQHERDHVLGDLVEAVHGHVGHRDAAPGGRVDVDVVHPDAEAADDPQP
jgi:hypothetical protein